MRYAIYNDSLHSFDKFGVSDIEYADTINPGGISTWNGNFSEFRNKGGKLLTYHGRSDAVCYIQVFFSFNITNNQSAFLF
jgi:hypothetical protein